ncbi:MAG: hypothetical protein RQ715_01490 [Methylococcales bacterium]|nr:hypothetical protein [Methylococcales bacterium]
MAKKELWLLAGGNGAGESTFYHTQLARRGIPFVNTDILAKQLYPLAPEAHSYDAAMLDNSRADNPFKEVAMIRKGKTDLMQDTVPEWARELLADYLLDTEN